jgi:hypothetical protein
MASQVLLGRLHRRDGMRRLMLRFRELLDVVLRRVELPRSRSISCGAAARCALFGAVAADCSSNRSRPSAFDQAKASAPMTPRPSATMARFKSREPVRPAASSPSSSTSKLATMDPPDAASGLVSCSPVAFNNIKHLARSMPADGLEAQDVVPGHFRRGDRFLGKAHTLARRSGDGSTSSHAAARAGPPRPAFPAFLAGAGRPLLPSMIDYSVFSRLAAARGSIISGPVSRSATAFNFRV